MGLLRAGARISDPSPIDNLSVVKLAKSSRAYHRLELKLRRKVVRRRVMRGGLLLSNILILMIVLVFVLQTANPQVVATSSILHGTTATADLNPVDQLSSASIALTVARLNSLPETTAITNQAQTQQADMAISSSDGSVLSKPQLVSTALKSKADIKNYTVQSGDTFASLAAKFGVTSDSIRWSNPTLAYNLTAGKSIVIPPVNGLVYTVKTGETADSLAAKFKASRDQIIAYNDAEISGLQPGEQIIIPNAPQNILSSFYGGYNYSSWGGPSYGSNGYDYGYCTWYVANRISVPTNWGNAVSWAYFAQLTPGWKVSSTPTVGSIAQTRNMACYRTYDGSVTCLGHVAIVEAVSPDGTQIQYSDMNGIAGYNHIGYSGWTPASLFQNYITRN